MKKEEINGKHLDLEHQNNKEKSETKKKKNCKGCCYR